MIVSWSVPCDWHVRAIAQNMRAIDAEECRLMSGKSPLESLTFGVTHSDVSFCTLADGEPVVLFGGHNSGIIWALGTDWATRYPMTFARHSRTGLAMLWDALDCDVVGNHVLAGNVLAIRWLLWIGAKVGDKRVNGIYGGEFLPFVLERG
jgi:hypothetical protein